MYTYQYLDRQKKAYFLTPEINNTYLPLIACTLCKPPHVITATNSLNHFIIFLPHEFTLKLSSMLLTCNSWEWQLNRPIHIYMITDVVPFLIFKNLHLLHKFLPKRSVCLEYYRFSDLENSLEESMRGMNHLDTHNEQDFLTVRMTYKKQRVFPRALNDEPFVMDYYVYGYP